MVTHEAALLIRLHRHWQRGVMPRVGGLLDQPAALIEAFEMIDALLAPDPAGD